MTVKGVARAVALGVAGLVAARGRTASAHPELSALGTNRYVTAAVFDGRVDVSDVLLEGTLVSGEERHRLDADGNGTIDAAEVRAGEARLRAEGPAFTLELDGRTLTTGGSGVDNFVVGVELGGEPRAESAPVVVERRLSFTGAWTAGSHSLRVAVSREPPRLLETEIGVVLGPGLAIRGGLDRVTFRGARASVLEERAGVFAFEAAMPPRRRGASAAVIVVVVIMLAAAALGVAWRRTRRGSAAG